MKSISKFNLLFMAALVVLHTTAEPIKLPSKKTICIIVGSIFAIAGIACGIHILHKTMNKKSVELNAYPTEFYDEVPLEEILVEEIPAITEKQESVLNRVESILPKYAAYRQKLKEDATCTGELRLGHKWEKFYYHEPRNPNKVYFLNEECVALDFLEDCKINCTESPDLSTGRACARLGELLESVGDAPAGYRQMRAADGKIIRVPYWKDQYFTPLAKHRPRKKH